MTEDEMETFKMYGRNWGIKLPWSGSIYYQDYNGEWCIPWYDDIIELLHPDYNWFFEIENSYQGDFFACGVKWNGKWAFISGSFGSCPLCDWLSSLNSVKDFKEFLTHFKKEIIIKESKKEIIEYMKETMKNTIWAEHILKRLIKRIEQIDEEAIRDMGLEEDFEVYKIVCREIPRDAKVSYNILHRRSNHFICPYCNKELKDKEVLNHGIYKIGILKMKDALSVMWENEED